MAAVLSVLVGGAMILGLVIGSRWTLSFATGRQVFLLALDLLDRPQELYRQAGPRVRQMLNRTIFTKLKIDGTKLVI